MTPGQRCDEIIRLIDEVLAGPAPAPARPPSSSGRAVDPGTAPAPRRPRQAA